MHQNAKGMCRCHEETFVRRSGDIKTEERQTSVEVESEQDSDKLAEVNL
jgi:hypothetical protein